MLKILLNTESYTIKLKLKAKEYANIPTKSSILIRKLIGSAENSELKRLPLKDSILTCKSIKIINLVHWMELMKSAKMVHVYLASSLENMDQIKIYEIYAWFLIWTLKYLKWLNY